MKKTFQKIFFICEDFSLNRKENELRRKYRVLAGSMEKRLHTPNFRDITKWMVPLDLARLRVYKTVPFFIYLQK